MNKVVLCLLLLGTGCRQNEHLKKDWAYLKRYAAENARLPPPVPDEHRIVFLGNSITEAWSYTDPGFFKNTSYINRGISGQTTSQMLVRFRQDVIELRPKIVVILAGTNDIAQNTGPITVEHIAGNIFSMAELARANGIEPVLCSVLPVKEYYWRKRIDPVPLIIRLNELVSSYCTKNNIIYIDYYPLLANKDHGLDEKYTSDGVHPNTEGYKRMDTLTEKAITEALQNKKSQ
jgi:lysophospholipase L1-like esterase